VAVCGVEADTGDVERALRSVAETDAGGCARSGGEVSDGEVADHCDVDRSGRWEMRFRNQAPLPHGRGSEGAECRVTLRSRDRKGAVLFAAVSLAVSPTFAQQVVNLPRPPPPPLKTIALPSKSPLVTFRIVFTTGAVFDPPEKPGLANLTAAMIGDAGTRELTYKQLLDALYPMAASVGVIVDKEMTTFSGSTHADNLDAYYKLFKSMLLDPGWREEDFRRVKDAAINAIKVGLRGNNDEELGKEVMYESIYQGSPYAHYNGGSISSLEKMALDDGKGFYKANYTQANLAIGLAGGYSPAFLETMQKDFRALPAGTPTRLVIKKMADIPKTRVVIVDKDTRSVAFSIGYPIDVLRGSMDYAALLLVSSYLGQHRMSSAHLYQRMRELRGLNYGDYAYVEYFPRGMFLMEP